MERYILAPPPLFLLHFVLSFTAAYSIGVNYGTVADNLPRPSQVANFLQTKTSIDRIKIFDANPDILRAFAGTNISVTVSTANADVPSLANLPASQSWLASNVIPFIPATKIEFIAVGNEIIATSDKTLIAHLVPAMRTLHEALALANLTSLIKVSTPHSLGILVPRLDAPSSARFRRGYDKAVFAPMLEYHRQTKSPFMVNPYPFFGFSPETLDYALFKPNRGVFDNVTKVNYTNMFDAQMDAVFSAMKRLGYEDVELVVAETGWPSAGDPNQPGVSLENAVSYNQNVVKHVSSGKGTPLMPNRSFETYIFSLFNENLKPTVSERNYGLFKPDFTPVYDVGILRNDQAMGPTSAEAPRGVAESPRGVAESGKTWCVAKRGASSEALQQNIDYVCSSSSSSSGVDCGPIQAGGPCFEPNTVASHASYAMNAYYQSFGPLDDNCAFNQTGLVTLTDPSYEKCAYPPTEGVKLAESDSSMAASGFLVKMWTLVAYLFIGIACRVLAS